MTGVSHDRCHMTVDAYIESECAREVVYIGLVQSSDAVSLLCTQHTVVSVQDLDGH